MKICFGWTSTVDIEFYELKKKPGILKNVLALQILRLDLDPHLEEMEISDRLILYGFQKLK